MREIYAQHSGMQGFFKLTSVEILSLYSAIVIKYLLCILTRGVIRI